MQYAKIIDHRKEQALGKSNFINEMKKGVSVSVIFFGERYEYGFKDSYKEWEELVDDLVERQYISYRTAYSFLAKKGFTPVSETFFFKP